MTALAPTLEAFFTERLFNQRRASPRTIASYRDALRLLVVFASRRTHTPPVALDLAQLDAPLITAFLDHLERERANSTSTRNTRLAAVHSFYSYASLRHPEHAAVIQRVLAVPTKRHDRASLCFLNRDEIDALLAAPDRTTWMGRRDHALLAVAIQTGLRVSELTALRREQVNLDRGPHLQCKGKGRKERATPLDRNTVTVLRAWFAEQRTQPPEPVFTTAHGTALSSDAIERLVTKHASTAARACPSLARKNVTPHTLRHSCAMDLPRAGVDITTIALWLGHESIDSVQAYIHADLQLKERALAKTSPTPIRQARYRPTDPILAFLNNL